MTTTQRPRAPRQAQRTPDPASRGLILVAVAVVLGIILLVKGGGIGFDRDSTDVEIGKDDRDGAAVTTTTTTVPPPSTSVAPAALKIVALNAAGVDGYAGQAQQFLSVAGFTTVTPVTAATLTESSVVYFNPGFEADARAVAELFGLPETQVQPMPADANLARDPSEFPPDTNVAIVLGPDVEQTVTGAAANNTAETTDTTAGTGTSGAGTSGTDGSGT